MLSVWITASTSTALTPTAVALGNFDGVHRGHRQVIAPVLNLPFPAYPTVVTFNPHPQEFFSGQPRALLTPPDEKVQQLQALGVEQLVLLPFDRELADLTPEAFVETILVQQLQARSVSVGADFCFGRKRAGTARDLQGLCDRSGIGVTIVELQTCQSERISSSAIREALQQGDLPRANQLLGRPYQLTGRVTQGQQLGRTIGFPTANLQLPLHKFLPRQGVYAVRVYLDPALPSSVSPDSPASPETVLGVLNIGYRPTVQGQHQTIEVHLLDWSGDLYGARLTVSLEAFLRPEQKFASLNDLKAQIQSDCETARTLFTASPPLPVSGGNSL